MNTCDQHNEQKNKEYKVKTVNQYEVIIYIMYFIIVLLKFTFFLS